jgi:uncharacterized repeat protein (TIGR02543 family)
LGENTFKSISSEQANDVSLNVTMDLQYYTGVWVDEANQEGDTYNTGAELIEAHSIKNTTITYVWQGQPVTIKINMNDTTDNTQTDILKVRYGQTIDLSKITTPKREGYIFKGWASSKQDADSKKKTKINETKIESLDDISLYAIWSKKSSSSNEEVESSEESQYKTVILANGNAYPDTLTSSVLANLKNAPILLSKKDFVDTTTLNEIKRLGSTEIIIVGGNQVVSNSVVTQLEKEISGVKVSRIWGEDRYQTAIKVGEEVRKLVSDDQSLESAKVASDSNLNSIILAVGTNFPDAMSVTSLAEYTNTPILLTQTETLNQDTQNALKNWGITNVTIIGKEQAVSQKVEDTIRNISISESELSNVTTSESIKNLSDIDISKNIEKTSSKGENSSGSSIEVERIGGEDRYETAKLIGEKLISLLENAENTNSITSSKIIEQAILVDGTNFPDTLTVSSLAGYYKIPILLTEQKSLNKITQSALKDWSISKITIAGGTNAVAKEIEDVLKTNVLNEVTIERLAGTDRYETAVQISQKYSSLK